MNKKIVILIVSVTCLLIITAIAGSMIAGKQGARPVISSPVAAPLAKDEPIQTVPESAPDSSEKEYEPPVAGLLLN